MPPQPPVEIFIAYSRKDEKLKDELLTSLQILQRKGMANIWHDGDILEGEWDTKIKQNLQLA